MTKKAQETTTRQTEAAASMPNFGVLVEFNERAFAATMKANETAIKSMAVLSEEMFSFIQTRLREDADTYEALLHRCRSPGEVYDCQHRFAEHATSQYLDMASKLASLGSRIAGSAWIPFETGMGGATGEIKSQSPRPTRLAVSS